MTKVLVYIASSLDGYIARENSGIDWLPDVPSEKIVMTQTKKSEDMKETGTVDKPLGFYGKGVITGEHFNGGVIWMAIKGDTDIHRYMGWLKVKNSLNSDTIF